MTYWQDAMQAAATRILGQELATRPGIRNRLHLGFAPGTVASYAQGWKTFVLWARRERVPYLPPTAGSICRFLWEHVAAEHRPPHGTTLHTRLTTARVKLAATAAAAVARMFGERDPSSDGAVLYARRALARARPAPPASARHPLPPSVVINAATAAAGSGRDTDVAAAGIVVVGYLALARAGSLASLAGADLRVAEDGALEVCIRDRKGRLSEAPHVVRQQLHNEHVHQLLNRYIELRRRDRIPAPTRAQITAAVRDALHMANDATPPLNVRYTAHSLRSGGACSMVMAGHSLESVAWRGEWRDTGVMRAHYLVHYGSMPPGERSFAALLFGDASRPRAAASWPFWNTHKLR